MWHEGLSPDSDSPCLPASWPAVFAPGHSCLEDGCSAGLVALSVAHMSWAPTPNTVVWVGVCSV